MVDKGWQVIEAHHESFRNAVNAGVRIAMGTDQGTPVNAPGENAQEMVRMAGLCMSNAAVLMATTAWAAAPMAAQRFVFVPMPPWRSL